jgi:addiction module HigA family antidote
VGTVAADTTPDPDGPVVDTLNAAAKVCREAEVLPDAIAGYLAPQFERWAAAPAYRSMTPQSAVVKAARAVIALQATQRLLLEWDDTHEGFTIISNGTEAGQVQALVDTLRQVMRERDEARAPLKSVAESVHPGEFLREELKARGLTQSACAEMAGRSVRVINQIIKGKKSITAGTALDLERALGVSAGFWVRLQAEHDLAVARHRRAGRAS